jgi:hypothetical protein
VARILESLPHYAAATAASSARGIGGDHAGGVAARFQGRRSQTGCKRTSGVPPWIRQAKPACIEQQDAIDPAEERAQATAGAGH